MPSNAPASTLLIERLPPTDLVAMAQCIGIDGDVFPHPSSRFVFRPLSSPVWIARRAGDGGVVGFLAASERRRGHLYIEGLATAPTARRHGVGRALLRAAIEAAHDARASTISLHVWTGNLAAVALYRSEAFGIRRRVLRFYRDGAFASTDAFEMVLVTSS